MLTEKVNCCDVPLHTRYLLPARATILAYLNQILPQTIIPNQMWRSLLCGTKLSCAEYFTNNLLNPVFFDKIAQLVPRNAVILEIAPDDILQSVTKELFDTVSITLLQRNHEDNVKVFLQGLGKMYNNGLQPQLANLYPTVEFPVSRSTPMIAPSIKYVERVVRLFNNNRVQNVCFHLRKIFLFLFSDGIISTIGLSHLIKCSQNSLPVKD